MNDAHKDEFDRIKREHETVVRLLSSLPKKRSKAKAGQSPGLPSYDPYLLEVAIVTADDAYALLLIARAEGFMRIYLDSLGVPLGPEPKLGMLIDRCRKEFNKTTPKIPIRLDTAKAVHDLRAQRNTYAHGYGAGVISVNCACGHYSGEILRSVAVADCLTRRSE